MFNVGAILDGTFTLIRQRYLAVAGWIGLYLILYVAMMVTMGPMLAGGGAAPGTINPDAIGAVILIGVIGFLVGIMLYAAAMRAVLRPQDDRFAYLRLGMDEIRLLGLSILFAIAAFVLTFGISMVFGLLIAAIGIGGGSPIVAGILSFVLMLAFFCLTLFLTVRVSLAFPLTLYRGRIVTGEAWQLSRGRFWTLFGAAFVIALIGFVLSIAISIITNGGYILDVIGAMGDSAAMLRVAEEQNAAAGQFGPTMILRALGGSIGGALWVALSGGSVATAAKLLVDDREEDAEAIFG